MTTDFENRMTPPPVPWRHRLQHGVASLLGKRFDRVLDGITDGQLKLTWPDGHITLHGKRSADPDANAALELHSWRALTRAMHGGELGFAEAYLQGDWSSDDLVRLFTLTMRNEHAIADALTGSRWTRLANVFNHWNNRNSLRGSRRNIAFHYDLGNAFYALWLDDSMSYSSALFDAPATRDLASAQLAKLDRVALHLDASPGASVLEIGCGWGALARRLAEGEGAKVDGISLSREQLDWAERCNGIETETGGLTRFRYQDYRAVEGRYDHVVSIEMFEAVGERYWVTYFEKLAALLEQGGSAVLQVITICEDRFEVYRAQPDFIQRYIFPGGMLPTKTRLSELARQAGLDLHTTDWFGTSYAETLARWRETFEARSREVLQLGFDERFLRMWRYYLAYCEAGFRFGSTDVGLLVMRKP